MLIIASGIDEGGKMSNLWTNVRFFSSFEEAAQLRGSLLEKDSSGTLQVKVKRCGLNGTLYVVKTRQSPELMAASNAVDEALAKDKTEKKTKRTKK